MKSIKGFLKYRLCFQKIKNIKELSTYASGSPKNIKESSTIASGSPKNIKELSTVASGSPKNIILCPGQGSQYVGMLGIAESSNKNIISEIKQACNDVLDYDLFKLCTDGPIETLTRTKYCQPAMAVSSLLAFERLKHHYEGKLNVDYVAGYSLGELPALYISGKSSIRNVIQLVSGRAEAMEYACRLVETSLVTLKGLSIDEAQEVCEDLNSIKDDRDQHYLAVAVKQYTRSVVVGGSFLMLNRLMNREHALLKNGDVKLSKLPVDGAFHTNYMLPAIDKFFHTLKHINFEKSDVNLFSNVTGNIYSNEDNIHDILLQQVIEPVLWDLIMENINALYTNNLNSNICEVGAGNSLKAIAGKCNRKLLRNFTNVK